MSRQLLCLLLAWAAASVSVAQSAPVVVDLTRADRAALVQARWRYSDARAVPAPFLAPAVDGQPGRERILTQTIKPRAGRAEFDDSAWPVIPAEALTQRRGTGHVSFGWYRLSFTLPETVDAGRIEAAFADGVLTVRLPKAEQAKPREIAVTAG